VTRLDATEDGDEAVGAGLLRSGEAPDELLLALRTRREVEDAPGGRLKGELFAGPLDPLAELQHGVAEILEQHAGGCEEGSQAFDVGQPQQGAHEAEAIEAAEGPLNLVSMSRYKGLHGVVSGGGSLGGLFVPYPGQRHRSPPLVAAGRPRCVSVVKKFWNFDLINSRLCGERCGPILFRPSGIDSGARRSPS